MPAYHDMVCDSCGEVTTDLPVDVEGSKCTCGGRLEIWWSAVSPRNAAAFGRDETTVVYEHPGTGKVMYPGRNDEPMPTRYAEQGYVRREMRSLREVDRFSERHGLVNEAAHYNRGNSYDDEPGRR